MVHEAPDRVSAALYMLDQLHYVPGVTDYCDPQMSLPNAVKEVPADRWLAPPPPLTSNPTFVFDRPSGESDLLFYRLHASENPRGVVLDIAAQDWLGQPIIGIQRMPWAPESLLKKAAEAGFAPERWFAYNRRDVGLACRSDGELRHLDAGRSLESAKLVWLTSEEIASWSSTMSEARKAFNTQLYSHFVVSASAAVPPPATNPDSKSLLCATIAGPQCVQRIRQQYDGWCVPAAVQIVLAFHSHKKPQGSLADCLGLSSNSTGFNLDNLPHLVPLIEGATNGALAAKLPPQGSWSWSQAKIEIDADQPFVAISGSHARAAGGYGYFELGGQPVEGLMCADPYYDDWSCWESIDSTGDTAVCAQRVATLTRLLARLVAAMRGRR